MSKKFRMKKEEGKPVEVKVSLGLGVEGKVREVKRWNKDLNQTDQPDLSGYYRCIIIDSI